MAITKKRTRRADIDLYDDIEKIKDVWVLSYKPPKFLLSNSCVMRKISSRSTPSFKFYIPEIIEC